MTRSENDQPTCSVCGSKMNRVKVLADVGRVARFRCTCGHCVDQKSDELQPRNKDTVVFALEGFQEIP